MADETWKPIAGFEGFYEVSSYGNVRGIDRFVMNKWGHMIFHASQNMKCRVVSNGYAHVKLRKDGHGYEPLVHRLVAEAFIPNPLNIPQINHIDGNKANNAVSNLEWCTGSENQLHSRRVLKRVCGRKRRPVKCLETNEIFESSYHAARNKGLKPIKVYHLCTGRIKQTDGLHFVFV